MEGLLVLDTEKCGLVDNQSKGEKMTKGYTIGSAPRKRLADISNLQQRPKPANQDANWQQQNISLATKEYIDKLRKVCIMRCQIFLSISCKIIELSGIELQKLRINLQKVQQQNLQFAQANAQMLAEINSGRDKLKALQHELGCKNGVLAAARKLVLEEKAKTVTCPISGNEVFKQISSCSFLNFSYNNTGNKPTNTNRRQPSKIKCYTCKRKKKKTKESDSYPHFYFSSRRRQSARFKSEETVPTADISDKNYEQFSVSSTVKPVQAKEKVDNKRRRQSARFKSEEPEPNEDMFKIDDDRFPVSPLCDEQARDNIPTSSNLSAHNKNGKVNCVPRDEAQEFRRTSVGRPLRQAAEKVQSYKEIPINVKMRRAE
ncbi:Shugoshin_C domain-containing protein [Cephalotus follicularis]|uniref:Shugoshin_C domain-containing protein n=1 Tax=Cephalotus follicularis TaxID=3775 RepID=A0A1Q3BI14_CEPFO|nr:Shugoshin_C domain-containing protein [Cephalotus follicularis]